MKREDDGGHGIIPLILEPCQIREFGRLRHDHMLIAT
jgi:hypothetical protein